MPISITDSCLQIHQLDVPAKEVVDFLMTVPEADRELTLVKAIEIGVFCLERGRTAQDTEFVKRQIAELLKTVDLAVTGIPDRTEAALTAKIGVGDGQVLAPVKQLLAQVSADTTTRINEVKQLLSNDLDPTKSTSTIGAALQRLREILDPMRSDSVQGGVNAALTSITASDGSLAATVKATVESAIKPLADEVNRLSVAVIGNEMLAEARDGTPAKGPEYEEEVAAALQSWAKSVGAHVEHVGTDNQPGDFVVELAGDALAQTPIRIVIEARNRQTKVGNQKIAQDLAPKFAERKGNAGIYLSKTAEGLAKEVGDWSEGICELGPWVACTHDHLVTAIRFLVVKQHLKKLREAAPEVDTSVITEQVRAVAAAVGRVKTIN